MKKIETYKIELQKQKPAASKIFSIKLNKK